MVSALASEESSIKGMWTDAALGIYIGWAARKGSFDDAMPLHNESRDVVLAFSGEEHSLPSAIQVLRDRGHDVGTGADYLVHLCEEDPNFASRLNGRFHGFLADRRSGTGTLFNDRYGMHRLYYYEAEDALYFSAEAKAILAIRPELRRVDRQSLGEFLGCGAVLENRSLFEGIAVLPPASAWVFRGGEIHRKTLYFTPSEWEKQETLAPEPWYQELRRVFASRLPAYFMGHQRIGMSLTGGLDTRIILASSRPEPGSLPCYTFGSMFHDNHDVRVARRVARICRQTHTVITAGPEFLTKFADYAWRAMYLSEGCVDAGRVPDLYLNEQAREIAPVRMTGNYGGEILRGVVAFKPTERSGQLFTPDCMASIGAAAETYRSIRKGHPLSFALFRQGPWYLQGILTLEQSQVSMRSPYLDNEFIRTVYRGPEAALRGNEVSLRMVADGDRELAAVATDRGLTQRQGNLFDAARSAMREFTFKAEYAYDMGMPQWLSRIDHGLAWLKLHRLFLGRHKPFHFRIWYRDWLASYLREMLLDERSLSRPYIHREGMKAAVEGHIRGDQNHTNEIHKVLALEILHRLFLDGGGAGSYKAPTEHPESVGIA